MHRDASKQQGGGGVVCIEQYMCVREGRCRTESMGGPLAGQKNCSNAGVEVWAQQALVKGESLIC